MLKRSIIAMLCFASLGSLKVNAHEFWIEPFAHVLQPGDLLEADLRVGQNYVGDAFPFLPNRFVKFLHLSPGSKARVAGLVGALPAVRLQNVSQGLQVLTYQSTPTTAVFDTLEDFEEYVSEEGNDWAVEAHKEAGLPETDFAEAFSRNAKALVQVGPPSVGDVDKPSGMPLELVALQSPYMLPEGQSELPVQLLWQNMPLVEQRINIFRRGAAINPISVTTNKTGRAMVPIDKGGRYLLNAVHMELNASTPSIAWDSFWASLTFDIGVD